MGFQLHAQAAETQQTQAFANHCPRQWRMYFNVFFEIKYYKYACISYIYLK